MKFLRSITFIIGCISVLVSCSKSEKEKMEESIETYMAEEFDGDEYEPVSYGNVDSVYEVMTETRKFKKLDDQLIKLEADSSGAAIMLRTSATPEEEARFKQNMDKVSKLISKKREEFRNYKQNFKAQHIGFEIPHTYRLNGDEKTNNFLLDTTLQVLKHYATGEDTISLE